MENVKICPQCGVEYYAHVTHCGDCHVELTDHLPEQEQPREVDLQEAVVIATGPVTNLKKLITLLDDAGISYQVKPIEGEKTLELTPSTLFGVYIAGEDTDIVTEIVKAKAFEENPEIAKASEQLDAGICPACGSETGEQQTCPECGLPLWFEEEGDAADDAEADA